MKKIVVILISGLTINLAGMDRGIDLSKLGSTSHTTLRLGKATPRKDLTLCGSGGSSSSSPREEQDLCTYLSYLDNFPIFAPPHESQDVEFARLGTWYILLRNARREHRRTQKRGLTQMYPYTTRLKEHEKSVGTAYLRQEATALQQAQALYDAPTTDELDISINLDRARRQLCLARVAAKRASHLSVEEPELDQHHRHTLANILAKASTPREKDLDMAFLHHTQAAQMYAEVKKSGCGKSDPTLVKRASSHALRRGRSTSQLEAQLSLMQLSKLETAQELAGQACDLYWRQFQTDQNNIPLLFQVGRTRAFEEYLMNQRMKVQAGDEIFLSYEKQRSERDAAIKRALDNAGIKTHDIETAHDSATVLERLPSNLGPEAIRSSQKSPEQKRKKKTKKKKSAE